MSSDTPRLHGAESSPLGRPAAYRDTYAPELLFPIERQLKRDELGLKHDALPFVGEDLWNAYELSWLDLRGKPVVALAQFRVPASSPRLIESKSLKLYLNAFNQQRCADAGEVQATIARDLSAAAGGAVKVRVEPLAQRPQRSSSYPEGVCLDELELDIDTYQPAPALLRAEGAEVSETLYSHLLKSNCLVTGQPDWGCWWCAILARKSTASVCCAISCPFACTTSFTSNVSNACSATSLRAAGRASSRCGRATRGAAGSTSTRFAPAIRAFWSMNRWKSGSKQVAVSLGWRALLDMC